MGTEDRNKELIPYPFKDLSPEKRSGFATTLLQSAIVIVRKNWDFMEGKIAETTVDSLMEDAKYLVKLGIDPSTQYDLVLDLIPRFDPDRSKDTLWQRFSACIDIVDFNLTAGKHYEQALQMAENIASREVIGNSNRNILKTLAVTEAKIGQAEKAINAIDRIGELSSWFGDHDTTCKDIAIIFIQNNNRQSATVAIDKIIEQQHKIDACRETGVLCYTIDTQNTEQAELGADFFFSKGLETAKQLLQNGQNIDMRLVEGEYSVVSALRKLGRAQSERGFDAKEAFVLARRLTDLGTADVSRNDEKRDLFDRKIDIMLAIAQDQYRVGLTEDAKESLYICHELAFNLCQQGLLYNQDSYSYRICTLLINFGILTEKGDLRAIFDKGQKGNYSGVFSKQYKELERRIETGEPQPAPPTFEKKLADSLRYQADETSQRLRTAWDEAKQGNIYAAIETLRKFRPRTDERDILVGIRAIGSSLRELGLPGGDELFRFEDKALTNAYLHPLFRPVLILAAATLKSGETKQADIYLEQALNIVNSSQGLKIGGRFDVYMSYSLIENIIKSCELNPQDEDHWVKRAREALMPFEETADKAQATRDSWNEPVVKYRLDEERIKEQKRREPVKKAFTYIEEGNFQDALTIIQGIENTILRDRTIQEAVEFAMRMNKTDLVPTLVNLISGGKAKLDVINTVLKLLVSSQESDSDQENNPPLTLE